MGESAVNTLRQGKVVRMAAGNEFFQDLVILVEIVVEPKKLKIFAISRITSESAIRWDRKTRLVCRSTSVISLPTMLCGSTAIASYTGPASSG